MRNKLINAITFLFCLGIAQINFAQNVGINTTGASPDNSAMLDIVSPDKGVLIPRMDSTSRKNIVTPAEGLMVFDSTYNSFYFYNGTAWSAIGSGEGSDNLGNHIATQNLQLNGNWLNNDGGASEGIMIDTSGKVGFGTIPDGKIHIDMGYTTPSTFESFTGLYGKEIAAYSGWQSFTAPKDAIIQLAGFYFYNDAANVPSRNISIYEGEGTGGTLLYAGPTETIGGSGPRWWYYFTVPSIAIQAGQRYTIGINNIYSIAHGTGYAGGTSNQSIGNDFNFAVYGNLRRNGFRVTDTTVVVNDYELPIVDGTIDQVLTTDGSGKVSWANKTANTDAQNLSLSGNTLSLTNDATSVDLNGYLDNTDTQDLNLSGNSLSLTNDATPVDLSGYLDNTDAQDLSLSANSLSLTNDATPVDLSGYLDNTDAQDLSLSANSLSLTNDGTPVDLSGYNQDLSLSGNTLSLTNDGTTVDLSSFAGGPDEMGNHTANQNIQLDTFWLSSDGGDEGIRIDNTGKVGFGRAVGTEGVPKFEYYGANGSNAGPHIQVVNSGDDYPLFQQLNWTHDNIALSFDAYYNGAWVSSNSIANYNIYKIGGRLTTHYSSGNSQGTAFTWSLGTSLDTLGRFGIGRIPTTNKLEVEGNASKTTAGNWLANSDARLKKNISSLSSEIILEKMLSLQGVTYEWNDNKTNTKRPEGIQYGFTAQNIQEVFPTLVTEDNNGFLQTPYGTYDAMTVEAIRALNDKIEKLEKENGQLKNELSELTELKSEIKEIKAVLKNSTPRTYEIVISEK